MMVRPLPYLPFLSLTLPYLTLPYLTLPYFTLPHLTLPSLPLPYFTLPSLPLPYLILLYLPLPSLTFPSLTLPYLTLPHLTSPTLPCQPPLSLSLSILCLFLSPCQTFPVYTVCLSVYLSVYFLLFCFFFLSPPPSFLTSSHNIVPLHRFPLYFPSSVPPSSSSHPLVLSLALSPSSSSLVPSFTLNRLFLSFSPLAVTLPSHLTLLFTLSLSPSPHLLSPLTLSHYPTLSLSLSLLFPSLFFPSHSPFPLETFKFLPNVVL